MSNYEYANGTGLSVLSQQIFEHLTPLVESVKVFFLASYDRENPPKIGKYIENEDGNSIWATEDNAIFAMEPWSDTPPERLPGMYLWTYTEAIFKDGSIYNSDPVCLVTWDDIDNAVSGMTASLEAGLALKADKATTYTKSDIDGIVNTGDATSEAANPLAIETDAAQYAKKTHLTLAPVQDLHGYDHPWPAGGGKNLLPMTVEGIKAFNIAGTWSGNVYTRNNLTFTILTDNDGNVTGIKVNGTASTATYFNICNFTSSSGNVFTGCPSGGSSTTYGFGQANGMWDYGNGATVSSGRTDTVAMWIGGGYTANNLIFYPMIRESSSVDSTFAPYSNICPITGVDEVEVRATRKNLFGGEANALFRLFIPSGTTVTASDLGGGNVRYYDAYQNEIDYWALINTESVSGRKYRSFTVSSDTYFVKFDVGSTTASDFQLEVGSAPTSYEPYISHTASLDLPEPVYSGELDLESGVLVATYKKEALDGTANHCFTNKGGGADNNYYYNPFDADTLGQDVSTWYTANKLRTNGIINSHFKYEDTSGTPVYFTAYCGTGNVFQPRIVFGESSSITTIQAANEYLQSLNAAGHPLEIVYKLKNPIAYQLTPQQLALFKGINNISANAKTVQVTYRNGELATTGDIVESTEVAKQNAKGESASYTDARLATELAPILGDLATAETSPASASHAVGEYLLYNNRLFKVLAAISAGQQLTIGTNVGQTNVAAELASQASMISVLNSRMSDTAGFHNGIYRGKNITSYLTDGSLWNRIKGTGGYALFEDLYLGDYITVGSNSYAIVDFDYYLRCGSVDLNEHHIVMMPTGNMNIPEGTALYGVSGQTLRFINTANAGVTVSSREAATGFKWNAKMSDPNTHNTNGGYKYSRMRQVIMKAANTIVINAFGSSHVKPITVLYPNPSSESASGIASGWAWFANDDQSAADAKSLCDLPNETQIYGQQVWGRGTVYTNMGYEVGTDKFQFAICALQRNFVDTRAYWWLRSVYSASYAALVGGGGSADNAGTAYAYGVRPRFLLVG